MLLRSQRLAAHGLAHGFSTREGGVSAAPFDALNLAANVGDAPEAVAENHARLARAVGYSLGSLGEVTQVHGARCVDVDAFATGGSLDAEQLRTEQADALMASRRGLAVGVRTADCVPILVADVRSRAVLAVHAGWRGAVSGVLPGAVALLLETHRSARRDLVVAIGPHIRRASFEVGDEVAVEIERAMPRGRASTQAQELAGEAIDRRFGPRPHASLATLLCAQLLELGLEAAQIDDVGGDTCAERDRFHSHRRDAARSGRMLSVIVAG